MSSYTNMPVCDLRNLSNIEEIRSIEKIKNTALVVFPKDVSDELASAFQSIPMKNIAATLWLNKNDPVSTINGLTEMSAGDFSKSEHTVLIVNGIAVITDMPQDASVSLYLNGIVILHEKLRSHPGITSLMTNGMRIYMAFDHNKIVPEKIRIEADMVTYMADNTLVVAGREIRIADDVTVEQLRDKQISFVAGKDILCPPALLGYIKAVSSAGHEIRTPDDDDADGDDDSDS